jgi:hypothetical protein
MLLQHTLQSLVSQSSYLDPLFNQHAQVWAMLPNLLPTLLPSLPKQQAPVDSPAFEAGNSQQQKQRRASRQPLHLYRHRQAHKRPAAFVTSVTV